MSAANQDPLLTRPQFGGTILNLSGDRLMPTVRREKLTRRMDWWPCFVCGVECRCSHREPEIVAFMEGR